MTDRREEQTQNRPIITKHSTSNGNVGSIIGPLWIVGWLFTIGYAQLTWWQALLALVVWPYFLGVAVRRG